MQQEGTEQTPLLSLYLISKTSIRKWLIARQLELTILQNDNPDSNRLYLNMIQGEINKTQERYFDISIWRQRSASKLKLERKDAPMGCAEELGA